MTDPPTGDTRKLREWMRQHDMFAFPGRNSKDRVVTDCSCLGTGWIGEWPGVEIACSRHVPALPYRFWKFTRG